MNQFKKYNLIVGWATFIFAAIVYLMTIEPTASLWDCSEFIATSDKLEVMHPPIHDDLQAVRHFLARPRTRRYDDQLYVSTGQRSYNPVPILVDHAPCGKIIS